MRTAETLIVLGLGASDPEMDAIERLARDAGIAVAYAADASGNRVHPGNAYKACRMISGERHYAMDCGHGDYYKEAGCPGCYPVKDVPDTVGTLYLVECDFPTGKGIPECDEVVRIDHHRPGDPGYDKQPDEYFAASSIGQFIRLLVEADILAPHYPDVQDVEETGWHVVGEAVRTGISWQRAAMIAAADHCLAAAYRGDCPGVEPDALMRWRVETRAKFQGRSVEAVLADVESARQRLRQAVEVPLPATVWGYDADGNLLSSGTERRKCADLRGQSIPELPEAAAREGIPFLADTQDRDGRSKVVLQAAPAGLVERFLAGEIVPGLVDMYGDPARGFAGGYLTS